MITASKTLLAAGLATAVLLGPMGAKDSAASAATLHRHHYAYAHHGWRYHRHYAWRRHYYYGHYYGPGPVLGGLGLLAGAAASLVVGPYYYGAPYPYYYYGPGPYGW